MSGRELDPDGTDSYHKEHPWEQTTHELYLPPSERTRLNWPPVPARAAGPHEAKQWRRLPWQVKQRAEPDMFGPGHSYPAPPPPPRPPRGPSGVSRTRRWWQW